MENLFLKFDPGKSPFKIDHKSNLLFLGSCFSDEIALIAAQQGFHCLSNPLGTIFHPLPLARFIKQCISGVEYERLLERNGRWFSWDASSLINGDSENSIIQKLMPIRQNWMEELHKTSVLFVTFGTAWGYKLSDKTIVANCHKKEQSLFQKELTESQEIIDVWLEAIDLLKHVNSEIKIVFTVSPVRHIRDGLVENNFSKAILIDALRRLNMCSNTYYFPSYEIVIDQLRDYRFFKQDRIHPTEEAVNVVWDYFMTHYTDGNTKKIAGEIGAYSKMRSHVPKYAGAEELSHHQRKVNSRRSELLEKYPFVQI